MIDNLQKRILKNITKTKVRFSEVDSMGVVWHGNYVKFIEDGREAFGKEFGLSYLDVVKHKVTTPIVKLDMDFKHFVKYGDAIQIETTFINSIAAKIIFDYKILRCSDNLEVLKARSIQVFVDFNEELLLNSPEFFIDWKKRWGIN